MKNLITTLQLIKSKKEKEDQATEEIFEAYGLDSYKNPNKTIDTPINIDWTPLGKNGEHFKSLVLKQTNSSRMEVNKSITRLLMSGVLTFIGLSLSLYGIYNFDQNQWLNFAIMGPIIIGIPLMLAGIYYFIFPRVSTFDRRYGWFWVGKRSLSREQDFILLKKSMRISEIAAVQVLTKTYSGGEHGPYAIWEVNIVSETGRRINVIDIGERTNILEDVQKLAEFLHVPVWDNE